MDVHGTAVPLIYGKLATKCPWIYGYFFTVYQRTTVDNEDRTPHMIPVITLQPLSHRRPLTSIFEFPVSLGVEG